MPIDPCLPPPAPTVVPHASSHPHRLSHHIGSRHIHRLRHVQPASLPARATAEGCGKHFADDKSGSLAARPTDGAPALGTGKGAALAAKLAAGSTASLFAAAAIAGALAMPAGLGFVSPSGHSPGSGTSVGSAPNAPGTFAPGPGLSPQGIISPGRSPSVVSPITLVPEPSSLVLLASFASLALIVLSMRRRTNLSARLTILRHDDNHTSRIGH